MIDYILSQDESFIIIQGIRAKESKAQAARKKVIKVREYRLVSLNSAA